MRKKGHCVGHLCYVHPIAGERYYLTILSNVVPGPTLFDDIRIVNDVVLVTYREACLAFGILKGDGEWNKALTEASQWVMPKNLTELFVTIMLFYHVSDPINLWMQNLVSFCDDVLNGQCIVKNNRDQFLLDEDIFNHDLYEVEKVMNRMRHTLREFEGMAYLDFSHIIIEEN